MSNHLIESGMVSFLKDKYLMLNFDDIRWENLKGAYRMPIDLRPLLRKLAADEAAWDELWQELYHQGNVGEAAFIALPHLVRIRREQRRSDWHTFAIAATIELARGVNGNPDVPAWARESYDEGLRDLAHMGLAELSNTPDQEHVRSILALLAIVYGARTYGRMLVEFTEDEILELERKAFGDSAE
ncbi:MAG: hypothetical protein JWQ98_2688 [Chlorobi bacterium]|nr:hypothetical protein [Chlorobiota bacterium]